MVITPLLFITLNDLSRAHRGKTRLKTSQLTLIVTVLHIQQKAEKHA